jgi:hypothetical protein
MTKNHVIDLLGEPRSQDEPLRVTWQSDQSFLENLAGAIIAKCVFDGWYERWEYGEFGSFENLFSPSDKAFVVYFNREGKVVKSRRPTAGPYSISPMETRTTTSQAAEARK